LATKAQRQSQHDSSVTRKEKEEEEEEEEKKKEEDEDDEDDDDASATLNTSTVCSTSTSTSTSTSSISPSLNTTIISPWTALPSKSSGSFFSTCRLHNEKTFNRLVRKTEHTPVQGKQNTRLFIG
jgi:hypothetical protein